MLYIPAVELDIMALSVSSVFDFGSDHFCGLSLFSIVGFMFAIFVFDFLRDQSAPLATSNGTERSRDGPYDATFPNKYTYELL